MFLPNMNFIYLTISEIWPEQDFSMSRSLWQGQGKIKVRLWCGTTTSPNQCLYHIWTSYTLQFLRYGRDKIFQGQGHYGKVKSQIKVKLWRCTPTPPTNVRTKYKHPTPYSYRDLARKRYFRGPPSRTPWVKTIPQSLFRLWGENKNQWWALVFL